MTFATRDNLFATKSLRRYTTVEVNGGMYRLQSLTEGEKSRYEASIVNSKGVTSKDARKRLLILMLVDAEGERLLTSADMDALEEVDGLVTSTLFTAAIRHAGFDQSDIDELVGNSREILGDSSASV